MPPPPTLPPPSPLHTHPATPAAFSRFGTIIQTPASPSSTSISANQGSATKHLHISPVLSQYPSTSPSASTNLHIFSCLPRTLSPGGIFTCNILERHPYTTQTFIPLGLSPDPKAEVYYVVIVAPTGEDGMPVVKEMVALRCRGDQAVTYNPGTWHAPMVVVGGKCDFVVVMAENGRQQEECEEVKVEGVKVRVGGETGNWGLWEGGAGCRERGDRGKV
ncbi:ureidoglycolate hydrolase [Wilcoxina mikolae CBS 423.85]|nr:ureidoglycolate hydrolase [Wilcoxina mikolae CBS 423.85]